MVDELPSIHTTPEPQQLSKLDETLGKFRASFHQVGSLISAVKAPIPTQTGDGSDLPKERPRGMKADLEDVISQMGHLGVTDVETLLKVQGKMMMHEDTDDRQYLMEHLIQAAVKANKTPDDPIGEKITDGFVTTLWNDLSHPPEMYLGEQWQYRKPDGSFNSVLHPTLGAAHQPYARTVKPQTLHSGALPDPGVIFDTVLARKKPEPHPNKISSILFYLASIIIHDVFRTSHTNFEISDTSSYLDLAPLYGSDEDEQRRMRTFEDGKLKPDCFSETRLLTFPPGVGCLLIMFNRFHNYVVDQLAAINEAGRFTKPQDHDTDGLTKYDEDLFQTGRLITCGLYVNIILIDYVRTILNLNRTDDNWQLNPRVDIPNGPTIGVGNQVSAEFNLVYRWHAAISDKDDKWTQELFSEIFQGKAPSEVPMNEFLKTLGHMEADSMKLDPLDRPFAKLQRQDNGNFKDDDLANFLAEGVDDCANAFGPQQVPLVMKAVEILGMQQARSWNLATLNEFRKHFALTPHKTFEDITQNKEVAEALKHLYDTPDNVELYPGLVVEDAKMPMLPGSGLCPSYTVSRAVLSDAVALVRGDRFYTTSYTPRALTNWGFSEVASDLTVDNGCVIYKLFLRTLPNNFKPNSVYVHYPMTVSAEMKTVLQDLGKADKYDFERPAPIPQPKLVFSYDAAQKIFMDPDNFKLTWGAAMEFLMGPRAGNFMLAGDKAVNADSRKLMEKAMYMGKSSREKQPSRDDPWLQQVRAFYETKTEQLLKQKSYKLAGVHEVDIIRDVGNLAHVHFCAEMFALPLKTEENPRGIFTEQIFYMIMSAVFICIFFDADPEHSFSLRQKAREATQQFGSILLAEVEVIRRTGHFSDLVKQYLDPTPSKLRDYGLHMIHRLLESGLSTEDLVWGNIMGTAGGMVSNQGQLFAQALDYLFNDGYDEHWPQIAALAAQDTPEADDKLEHYILEASRLSGETGVYRWVTKDVTIKDGDRTLDLKAGDKIMVVLKAASRDPTVFPNPDQVDLARDIDSYIHLGHGLHQCLGLPMTRVALTTMLKTIAKLPGLKPAMVWTGKKSEKSRIKKVMMPFPEGVPVVPESWHYHVYLTEKWDMYFPFPTCEYIVLSFETSLVGGFDADSTFTALKLNWVDAETKLTNGSKL